MCEALLKLTQDGDRIDSIVDFSCFKPAVLADTLKVINMMRSEGRLIESQPVRYCFISTDSTYDASALILDSHKHKLYNPEKQQAEGKPKLPQDKKRMYAQTYTFGLL